MEGASTGQVKFYPYRNQNEGGGGGGVVRRRFMSTAGHLSLYSTATQKSCVGQVHFMLFVSVSFALGGQRKPNFQWNMGFTLSQ